MGKIMLASSLDHMSGGDAQHCLLHNFVVKIMKRTFLLLLSISSCKFWLCSQVLGILLVSESSAAFRLFNFFSGLIFIWEPNLVYCDVRILAESQSELRKKVPAFWIWDFTTKLRKFYIWGRSPYNSGKIGPLRRSVQEKPIEEVWFPWGNWCEAAIKVKRGSTRNKKESSEYLVFSQCFNCSNFRFSCNTRRLCFRKGSVVFSIMFFDGETLGFHSKICWW